jgi:LysM repeat protein
MNAIRILTPSLIAIGLVSCASKKADEYDTPNPYGPPPGSAANPAAVADANPVYDTPAAYEETSGNAVNPAVPSVPAGPAAPTTPATPATPTGPSNGAATIHTVVAGDTLSGISAKYKVPAASIKQANRMTTDTVVLGRKMVIPPK